jgi:hypothetical protein
MSQSRSVVVAAIVLVVSLIGDHFSTNAFLSIREVYPFNSFLA